MPEPLPPELLRAAAGTFPRSTGLGADTFLPRWLLLLSDKLISRLAAILFSMEATGLVPSLRFAVTLVHFIAKQLGGVRSIFLFVTPFRVWTRARRIVAQA